MGLGLSNTTKTGAQLDQNGCALKEQVSWILLKSKRLTLSLRISTSKGIDYNGICPIRLTTVWLMFALAVYIGENESHGYY
jgi:hypothetical protein